jgi:hypothetical protein
MYEKELEFLDLTITKIKAKLMGIYIHSYIHLVLSLAKGIVNAFFCFFYIN